MRRHAGDHVRWVVVVGEPVSVEAPPRRRRRARPRPVPPGPPAPPGPVTRVTVIGGDPLTEPRAWLERADEHAAEALDVLRRTVAAHRVAAADPLLADPDPGRALVTRVGYGSGEQVADGDWSEAVAPAGPRRGRDLSPQERLAALLAGRDVALACEELALRARADVDAGRSREAALQLEAALAAAVAELEGWRAQRDLAARHEELAALRDPVAAAASAARAGTLEPADVETVERALGRLEAALRARAVAAAG